MNSDREGQAADGHRSLDDRQLLAAHVAGDPRAFGEIVRRHRDRLWRFARQTLDNVDDADDAVQTGLERAFRKAGTYRGDAAVTSWLYRIITNAALDQVIKGDRGVTLVPARPEDLDGSIPDTASERLAVHAALNALPENLRAAFFLVADRGFTQKEAADLLNVPHVTIKTWVARARVRLVEYLDEIENSMDTEE